jgi:hypothetical protein
MKIFRDIFYATVAFFLTADANAQDIFRREWTFGVTGGITLSRVVFVPKVEENLLEGAHGGILLRWITERNLGLQLELNYKQEGWRENFADIADLPVDANYRFTRRMNYLEIPFLTHIYFGGGRTRFFVNAGPQLAWLLSEDTYENLEGAVPTTPYSQHTMFAEKRLEWGIGGGPGVEFRSSWGHLQLEGRFYYALSDFYNTRYEDAFGKASPQVYSLRLAYLFPLGRR